MPLSPAFFIYTPNYNNNIFNINNIFIKNHVFCYVCCYFTYNFIFFLYNSLSQIKVDEKLSTSLPGWMTDKIALLLDRQCITIAKLKLLVDWLPESN